MRSDTGAETSCTSRLEGGARRQEKRHRPRRQRGTCLSLRSCPPSPANSHAPRTRPARPHAPHDTRTAIERSTSRRLSPVGRGCARLTQCTQRTGMPCRARPQRTHLDDVDKLRGMKLGYKATSRRKAVAEHLRHAVPEARGGATTEYRVREPWRRQQGVARGSGNRTSSQMHTHAPRRQTGDHGVHTCPLRPVDHVCALVQEVATRPLVSLCGPRSPRLARGPSTPTEHTSQGDGKVFPSQVQLEAAHPRHSGALEERPLRQGFEEDAAVHEHGGHTAVQRTTLDRSIAADVQAPKPEKVLVVPAARPQEVCGRLHARHADGAWNMSAIERYQAGAFVVFDGRRGGGSHCARALAREGCGAAAPCLAQECVKPAGHKRVSAINDAAHQDKDAAVPACLPGSPQAVGCLLPSLRIS